MGGIASITNEERRLGALVALIKNVREDLQRAKTALLLRDAKNRAASAAARDAAIVAAAVALVKVDVAGYGVPDDPGTPALVSTESIERNVVFAIDGLDRALRWAERRPTVPDVADVVTREFRAVVPSISQIVAGAQPTAAAKA